VNKNKSSHNSKTRPNTSYKLKSKGENSIKNTENNNLDNTNINNITNNNLNNTTKTKKFTRQGSLDFDFNKVNSINGIDSIKMKNKIKGFHTKNKSLNQKLTEQLFDNKNPQGSAQGNTQGSAIGSTIGNMFTFENNLNFNVLKKSIYSISNTVDTEQRKIKIKLNLKDKNTALEETSKFINK